MFYVWVINHQEGSESFYTTGTAGRPRIFASREEAERFIATDHPATVPAHRATYTVHEGDPANHGAAPQALYPINPDLPMELEDGTPVEFTGETCGAGEDLQIRVRCLRDPVGPYPCPRPSWWHYASNGEWAGDPSYLRLRNVGDPNAPQLPAWKLEARYADHSRPAEAKVPWKDADWHKSKPEVAEVHFPHLAMEDEVPMVAFYASEQHAERERLTKMRPGRYLKRYFGETLDNDEIERLTAEVTVQAGAMTVRWTQDADEIETIYRHGPSSCMSGSASKFIGHCHPARVYAGPDLAVAWLGDMDDATARCIVWPERKVYGGLYGDYSRMRLLLENLGFTEGDFDGAKFCKIRDENGNGLIMPYLDIGSAYACDDHCVIGHSYGGYSVESDNTCGTSEDNSTHCERCEDRCDEEDTFSVLTYVGRYEDHQTWCEHCTEQHTTRCDHTDEYVADHCVEVIEVHGSTNYVERVREDRMADAGFVYVESRGEWWNADCTFTCDDCGEVFHEDDRDGRDTGADLCEGCADERAEQGDEGNVTPALQPASELLAAEAEGQMRLPVELPEAAAPDLILTGEMTPAGETVRIPNDGSLYVIERNSQGLTVAVHQATLEQDDGSAVPFRITFGEWSGHGLWFKPDGSCVHAAHEGEFHAFNLPTEASAVSVALALAA